MFYIFLFLFFFFKHWITYWTCVTVNTVHTWIYWNRMFYYWKMREMILSDTRMTLCCTKPPAGVSAPTLLQQKGTLRETQGRLPFSWIPFLVELLLWHNKLQIWRDKTTKKQSKWKTSVKGSVSRSLSLSLANLSMTSLCVLFLAQQLYDVFLYVFLWAPRRLHVFYGALFLFSFNFNYFFKLSYRKGRLLPFDVLPYLPSAVRSASPSSTLWCFFFVFVVEGHVSCVPLWLHGLLVINVLLVRIGKMTIVTVEYPQHLIIINIMTKQCCCSCTNELI